jgi:hypothetical protein
MALGLIEKQRKQRKTADGLAVILVVDRTETQDFRGEREVARCKIPARTAKNSGRSSGGSIAFDPRER